MTLTPFQLSQLRQDLRDLANIEYDEVEAELLDHYAALTEQKMASGLDFDRASAFAWQELGGGVALQDIQAAFVKMMRKQIRARHWQILKSYFRWPTVVTTALVGVLFYQLASWLDQTWLGWFSFVCVLTPATVSSYGYLKALDRYTDVRKVAWEYLSSFGSLPVHFANMVLNFGTEPSESEFLAIHTSIMACVSFLCFLYMLTFLQLFHEKFSIELPFFSRAQ